MNLRQWWDSLRGKAPTDADDEVRVMLDQAEVSIASRLSKLTGKRRDEVLAESYRRADVRRAALRAEVDSLRHSR